MQDSLVTRLQDIERSLKWLREDVHALQKVANAIAETLREAIEDPDEDDLTDEDYDPPSDEWGSMTQTPSM